MRKLCHERIKKREHFQTNIPIFLTPSNALNDALINPVQENSWNYSFLSHERSGLRNVLLFCFLLLLAPCSVHDIFRNLQYFYKTLNTKHFYVFSFV